MKEFKGHSEAQLSLIYGPRKKMETPSNKPEISSMYHEEEEAMQHDISKLPEQVQQNSLSQKVTKAKMDGLKKGVEAKMDGVEDNMDGLKKGMEAKMNDMEAKMNDMEAKMDGLNKCVEAKMNDVEANMEGKWKI